MDRNKIIFIGVIAFVTLLLVIYSMMAFGGKETKTESMTMPEVEITDAKQAYNSRLEKAKSQMVPKEEIKPLDSRISMQAYGEEEPAKEKEETEEKTEKEPTKSEKAPAQKIVYVTRTIEKPTPQQKTITQEAESEKPKEPERGGFGIVINNNISQKSTNAENGNAQSMETVVVGAYLEETIKIKEGTSMVFILSDDAVIDGLKLSKNAILFGKARDTGSAFDVSITQAKNTDGKIYAISNLFVYDERFSRGITHNGAVDQAIKEGSNDAINSGAQNIYGNGSISENVAERGVGVAVNTVENTIKNLSKKKENSISLSKGYKVFLKRN